MTNIENSNSVLNLEKTLQVFRSNFTEFYNTFAEIDNNLQDNNDFLLNNGHNIQQIFSNVDTESIFTQLSDIDANTEPITIDTVHLTAVRPVIIPPYDTITFTTSNNQTIIDLNQYFETIIENDTLQYIIKEIPNIRPSLESNIPFINNTQYIDINIDNILSTSNYIINNSLLIINSDFRGETINIPISAINTSKLYKLIEYDSVNYLSDTFTFVINELYVPSIFLDIKYSNSEYIPISNNDTYIFNQDFVTYNLINNKQTSVNIFDIQYNIDSYLINNNQIILNYTYQLTDRTLDFYINDIYDSNFNYQYSFDYKGSNNQYHITNIQIKTIDPIFVNVSDNSFTFNLNILEPSPIELKLNTISNFTERLNGYDTFNINFNDYFINNISQNTIYTITSNINNLQNNRITNQKLLNQIDTSNISINTDFRNTTYNIIVEAIDINYNTQPTFYNFFINELSPPVPKIIVSNSNINISDNIDLYQYFQSSTSNLNLQFLLNSNNYPNDIYSDIFNIQNNLLILDKTKFYQHSRILTKTVIAIDTIYNTSNSLEFNFEQLAVISNILPIQDYNDIVDIKLLKLNEHYQHSYFTSCNLTFEISTNPINIRKSFNTDNDAVLLNTINFRNEVTIEPNYRTEPYSILITTYLNEPLYKDFKFYHTVKIKEKLADPPFIIKDIHFENLILSNIHYNIDLLDYFSNPIDSTLNFFSTTENNKFDLFISEVTFKPFYRNQKYNIEFYASNIDYNLRSENMTFIINELNPITVIKDIETINIPSDPDNIINYFSINLQEYYYNKDNIPNNISYNITSNNIRNNISEQYFDYPVAIINNHILEYYPDFRNKTYNLTLDIFDTLYSNVGITCNITLIEGSENGINIISPLINLTDITTSDSQYNLGNYFDFRYKNINKKILEFRAVDIIYNNDTKTNLYYDHITEKLYYTDVFQVKTNNIVNIIYTNTLYHIYFTNPNFDIRINNTSVLNKNNTLFYTLITSNKNKNLLLHFIGENKIPIQLCKTLDNNNINNYIEFTELDNYQGYNLILKNLFDKSFPKQFNIDVLFNNLLLNSQSNLTVRKPIVNGLIIDNLKDITSNYYISNLIPDTISFYKINSFHTDKYIIDSNILTLTPNFRNQTYIIDIDILDFNDIILSRVLYKIIELPAFKLKDNFLSNFTLDYSNLTIDIEELLIINCDKSDINLEINETIEYTYKEITSTDNYNNFIENENQNKPNIFGFYNGGSNIFQLDNQNKKINFYPEFRDFNYKFKLDIKNDIFAINYYSNILFNITEKPISNIIINNDIDKTLDFNQNQSNIIIPIFPYYNYVFKENLIYNLIYSDESILNSMNNTYLENNNIYFRFDYRNISYDITVYSQDEYFNLINSNLIFHIHEISPINSNIDYYNTVQNNFINVNLNNYLERSIDLKQLFINKTHYDDSSIIFNIQKVNTNKTYTPDENNIFTLIPTNQSEMYKIKIEAYINNYESTILNFVFDVFELPKINLLINDYYNQVKQFNNQTKDTKIIELSKLYNIYQNNNFNFLDKIYFQNSNFVTAPIIQDNNNFIKKYINIQYDYSFSNLYSNEPLFIFYLDSRGISYNYNIKTYYLEYEDTVNNFDFIININEKSPFSNILDNYTINTDTIYDIKDNFTNKDNLIIELENVYEIINGQPINTETFLIKEEIFGFTQDLNLQPFIDLFIYKTNYATKSIETTNNNLIIFFWFKINFTIIINNFSIKSNLENSDNWFNVLIICNKDTGINYKINNINNELIKDENILTFDIFKNTNVFTIQFINGILISKLNFYSNMNQQVYNSLLSRHNSDIIFQKENKYRYGKNNTTNAFGLNDSLLNINLSSTGKQYQLLFNVWINNYKDYKIFQYPITIIENNLDINCNLSPNNIYHRSLFVESTYNKEQIFNDILENVDYIQDNYLEVIHKINNDYDIIVYPDMNILTDIHIIRIYNYLKNKIYINNIDFNEKINIIFEKNIELKKTKHIINTLDDIPYELNNYKIYTGNYESNLSNYLDEYTVYQHDTCNIVEINNSDIILNNYGRGIGHDIRIFGHENNIQVQYKLNIIEPEITTIDITQSNIYLRDLDVANHKYDTLVLDNCNITIYPFLQTKPYTINLNQFYEYYRIDFVKYYICNLDLVDNIYIDESNLVINKSLTENNNYNFYIGVFDPLTLIYNDLVNFNIYERPRISVSSQDIIIDNIILYNQPYVINIKDIYTTINQSDIDSNIIDVQYNITDPLTNLNISTKNNLEIDLELFQIKINPDLSDLQYNIKLLLHYKDYNTNSNIINSYINNSTLLVTEKPPIEFINTTNYKSQQIILSDLSNIDLYYNLIENIQINHSDSNFNDLVLSNIVSNSNLRNAYYKTNLNAYDISNFDLYINPEYRNTNYQLDIFFYFNNYSNQKIIYKFDITELNIPEILTIDTHNCNYSSLSNQVISYSNILDNINYTYKDKLIINYEVSPSNILDIANNYDINIINNDLFIKADYRDIDYHIKLIIYDPNFSLDDAIYGKNNINDQITFDINEISPIDIINSNVYFNNLTNNILYISLNQYFKINIPNNTSNYLKITNQNNVLLVNNQSILSGNTNNIEFNYDIGTVLYIDVDISINEYFTITNNLDITDTTSLNSTTNNNIEYIEGTHVINIDTKTFKNTKIKWDTQNEKVNSPLYCINNKTKYQQGANINTIQFFIIKFQDNNLDIFKEHDINIEPEYPRDVNYPIQYSQSIIHLNNFKNQIIYNSDYRNETFKVPFYIKHLNYQNQIKTIILHLQENSIDPIVPTITSLSYISSNKNVIEYNLFEVYSNYPYYKDLIFTNSNIYNNESNVEFIIDKTADQFLVKIYPDFRRDNYDIQIITNDSKFENTDDSLKINLLEYPPISFNNFNITKTIELFNLTSYTQLYNLYSNVNVYAIENQLLFSNNYLSNYPIEKGYYNSLNVLEYKVNINDKSYCNLDLNDYNDYNILFHPEWRNKEYEIWIDIYMSGYEHLPINIKFNLQENKIPVIISDVNIISLDFNSNQSISYNLHDFYSTYPYSNQLQFYYSNNNQTLRKINNIYSLNNNLFTINPDYRDDNYNITISAYDPYFTLELSENQINSDLEFKISETPPIEFNFTNKYLNIVNLSNLGKEQIIFDITNDITFYSDCNYIISTINQDSFMREAYYVNNIYSNALIKDNDLLYITPEYRNQNYNIEYSIYINGYEEQNIIRKFNISECNIPDIEFIDNIKRVIISTGYKFINLHEQFSPYPLNTQLQFEILYAYETYNDLDSSEYCNEILHLTDIYQNSNLRILPNALQYDNYNIQLAIKATDQYFNITSPNLIVTLTEKLPIIFKMSREDFYIGKELILNIDNLTNQEIVHNFSNLYVDYCETSVVIIPHEINSRDAFYPHRNQFNTINSYQIVNDLVYFLPEYRNTNYSNKFKIHAENYPEFYILINCIVSENKISDIIYNSTERNKIIGNNIEFTNSHEVTYNISNIYKTYPYYEELQFYYNEPLDVVYNHNILSVDSNLNLIFNPRLRKNNYNLSIIAKDKFTDNGDISENTQFLINIDEKPPLEFININTSIESNFINNLTYNQVICNLYCNVKFYTDPDVSLKISNIYIEDVRKAFYKTGDDINAINRLDDYNIYINPEFRNQTYIANFMLYMDTFEEISINKIFIIQENEIIPIQYHTTDSFQNLKLSQETIQYSNLIELYQFYPFYKHLQFTCNITPDITNGAHNYDVNIDNCNLTIEANYRGLDYNINIIAIDSNFNISNIEHNIIINEKPPIEFIINDVSYLLNSTIISNLTKEQITCNINDYVQNNISNLDLLYINNGTLDSIRDAYYIDNKKALTFENSNIIINPEYRNQTYTYSFNIYLDGYIDQKITSQYIITECNIPEIKFKHLNEPDKFTFCNLSNNYFNYEDLTIFYDYPFQSNLKIIFTNEIFDNPSYSIYLNTDLYAFKNFVNYANFRNITYKTILTAFDPYFTNDIEIEYNNYYLSNNDINNCNLINTDFNFIFNELPPIQFKDNFITNTSNLIVFNELSNQVIPYNLLDNIKFNADYETITYEMIHYNNPRIARYYDDDRSNSIYFNSTSNIILYPEFRNDDYSVDFKVSINNYNEQPTILTIQINEINIPDIIFKYSNLSYSNLSNNDIQLPFTNNLIQYYSDYPFYQYLEFDKIITPTNVNQYSKDYDITIIDKNITINADVRNMDYIIEIQAYDPKFTYDSVYNSSILTNSNSLNNKFQILLSELAPIEFIDDPKVIICNLTDISITYDLYSNIKINHPDYTFTDIRIELTNDINIGKGYYNYLDAFIIDNSIPNILNIHPEYRNNNFNLIYQLSIPNYSGQNIYREIEWHECNIPEIILMDNINVEFSNLSNQEITISNIKDNVNSLFNLFTHIYYDKLQFNYQITSNKTPLYPLDYNIDPFYVKTNFRDINYDINVIVSDSNFNLINSNLVITIHEIPPIEFKFNSIINVPYSNIQIIKDVSDLFISNTSSNIIIEKIDNDYAYYNISNNQVIIEYDPLFAGLYHDIQLKAYSIDYEYQSNIYTIQLKLDALELIFTDSSFEVIENYNDIKSINIFDYIHDFRGSKEHNYLSVTITDNNLQNAYRNRQFITFYSDTISSITVNVKTELTDSTATFYYSNLKNQFTINTIENTLQDDLQFLLFNDTSLITIDTNIEVNKYISVSSKLLVDINEDQIDTTFLNNLTQTIATEMNIDPETVTITL